jgi:glutathione synthase
MKIAFVINELATEKSNYTTICLASKAHEMGHKAFVVEVGDLAYTADGYMGARARRVSKKGIKNNEEYFVALKEAGKETITAEELDVLFLRNNPADEIGEREWAQNAAFIFGQIAVKNGVIVLNNPSKLANAINKMYFQHFPEVLRPSTIISRDVQEIKAFLKEQNNYMILKPLQGSGGSNVFIVDKENVKNLNQIIEAITRDGFVIAQEYLPAASKGDTRLFLMNGEPLCIGEKYAAIQRINHTDDIRSNVHAGGRPKRATVTKKMLELAEILRPKLIKDGMFLVGIDIAGDKLMEINVFSPGGLNMMSAAYKADFLKVVIEAIERKVYYRKVYGDTLENKDLACL